MGPRPSSGNLMENPMSDSLSATTLEFDDSAEEAREGLAIIDEALNVADAHTV